MLTNSPFLLYLLTSCPIFIFLKGFPNKQKLMASKIVDFPEPLLALIKFSPDEKSSSVIRLP